MSKKRFSMSKKRWLRSLGLAAALTATGAVFLAFAGGALAQTSYTWNAVNGWPNSSCSQDPASPPSTMLWIFNPHSGAVPMSLTINGELQTGSWTQSGGSDDWHFIANVDLDLTNYPPTDVSLTYTGMLSDNPVLMIHPGSLGGSVRWRPTLGCCLS
jgi:hypothetical protein